MFDWARTLGRLSMLIIPAACAHPGRPVPARAACPAPHVDTKPWRTVSQGPVVYRIPDGFVRSDTQTATYHWERSGDFQQYVTAGFIESSSPAVTLGRTPSPGVFEMTQCVDSIGGREVLVQSWRTRGGVYRDFKRLDRYDVFAVVPVTAMRKFYIASGSYRPETQTIALALVRSIIVVGPRTR